MNDLRYNARSLDRATLVGIVASFGLVVGAIMLGEGALTFLDLPSFLIVVGGTVGATLINFPLQDFFRTSAVLRNAFFPDFSSGTQRVRRILDLAERVRTEGILALQEEIYRENDPFLKKVIELVVDGVPAEDVRRIMDIELQGLEDRHRRGAQLFQTMGTLAPAMGLLGTVIGLVQMLKHLDNSAAIGPAMAVALITTFYGSLLSNLVFLPLAGKLRTRSEEEQHIKEMSVEGILSIAKGMNPRILEECLLSFLPPEARLSRYR